MPIYLHNYDLIVPKSVLETKYKGGIEQFKKDYFLGDEIIDMEDGELVGRGFMNLDEIDVQTLVDAGLSYKGDMEEEPYSDDFIIIGRYDDPPLLWPCNWIVENRVHAWHINASEANKNRAEGVGNMTIDQIYELIDLDQNPLRAFWIKD